MNGSRQISSASASDGRALVAQPPGQAIMVPPDRVDLRGSVSFFRRRLSLILAITALAIAIGAIITFMTPAVYKAEALVSLETPQAETARTTGAAVASGPAPSSAFVDTQVAILTSRELAARVGEALGLMKGKSAAEQRDVIDELQNGASAERSGESYALTLTYEAPNARDASLRANEFARQFTQWELLSSKERNQDSIKLIANRLNQLRAQAHADTEALQRYRIANNLLSTSGASLTEQEISAYNQEVTKARAMAAEDQARLDTALAQLRSGSSGEDVGEALGSSVVSSLRSRVSEVGGEVANLESRYGPSHPQLVRAKGELAELQRQIQAEIGRVVSNLEAKRDVSQQRLGSLSGSLAGARGQLSQNNAAMVGLDELQRTAEVSQGLYETYLNSYKQLVAEEGTERANARILSNADTPILPSSPNVPMNMLLSVVIGLGAGLAAAFVAESLFHGITSPDEIENVLGVRYLCSIPLLASVSKTSRKEVMAIVEEPRSAFAESFRSLRTSIEQATQGPAQVIAITSALPKEGKTITSACLAQTLAAGGASTVLVDCDLRRRGVTRLLRLGQEHDGLVEVLEGNANLSETLIIGNGGLAILPIRPADSEPEALLVGNLFERLIDELRMRYEYIILDLPPVLPIAATRTLASRADATVMIVRWRKTPEAAVRAALQQLPPDRINLAGIALTQIDMRRRRQFGSNDPAFYYKQYQQYYS